MMVTFLSNRRNLYGLLCLSYFIVGYLCTSIGLTYAQLTIVCIVMGVGNYAQWLLGYEQGIKFTTSKRPNFIMELDKLNELVRKENKKTSNKKRNSSKKKKGCGSGGCKNC